MKTKSKWMGKVAWIVDIIFVAIGFVLFVTAQGEMASNPSYGWDNPWSMYGVRILRMNYFGIILLLVGLPGLARKLYNKKMLEKTRKECAQYYLRGGFVVCSNCGLTVLGEAEVCPCCSEKIAAEVWDGKVDKIRTTTEVPMQTKDTAEVLRIYQMVLEPQGYMLQEIEGEKVWTKGNEKITGMQCVGAVFTGKSVLIQGWIRDTIVGESALSGVGGMVPKKAQKELIEKISLLIRSRKL